MWPNLDKSNHTRKKNRVNSLFKRNKRGTLTASCKNTIKGVAPFSLKRVILSEGIFVLKIFISYSSAQKEIAGELKRWFEEHDVIECFIAHDDIVPESAWEQEILMNLETSDFFMPLQTENMSRSFWCQQEAGFAVAKKIRIIPLIPNVDGVDPVGFYAKYQGFRIRVEDLRGSVRKWLIQEGVSIQESTEDVEKAILLLESSRSFIEAGKNTKLLLEMESKFIKADILRVMGVAVNNSEILHSWDARSSLKPFIARHIKLIPKEQVEIFLKAE